MQRSEAKERIAKLRDEINHHRYQYHVLDRQEISDAALDADLKTIDAHTDAAATAGASANSFTDTPVQQTE